MPARSCHRKYAVDTTQKLAVLFADIGRKVFCITYNNTKIFDAGTPLYGFYSR